MLGRVGVVGHAHQCDEQSHEYGSEHGVVYHLPVIVVGKPCRNPCAYLSEQHEEEVDDRLARLLLGVESVPSCFVLRLVTRRNVACSLNAKSVLDKCEEVAHEKRLSDKSHDEAVESQDKQTVGVGTYIALHSQNGESNETHHLLAAHTHQRVEERRERRHTYRCDEADEGYVF